MNDLSWLYDQKIVFQYLKHTKGEVRLYKKLIVVIFRNFIIKKITAGMLRNCIVNYWSNDKERKEETKNIRNNLISIKTIFSEEENR